jgi:ferredoxin-NADP reductase
MEQTLRVGSTVWIKLPYGDFVIDDTVDVVLVAGGTGISAFTAFLGALTPQHAREVRLIYGVRSPELFLFGDLIRAQRFRVPNFHVIQFAERPGAPDGDTFPGRIALDRLWNEVPAPAHRVWYLSGPPPMLSALGSGLRARGVAADRVRIDAWE